MFREVSSIDNKVKRNHVIAPESSTSKSIVKRVIDPSDLNEEKILQKPSMKKEKSTLSAHETATVKIHGASQMLKKITREKDISFSLKKEDMISTSDLKKSLTHK